jgi:hypothetical protein
MNAASCSARMHRPSAHRALPEGAMEGRPRESLGNARIARNHATIGTPGSVPRGSEQATKRLAKALTFHVGLRRA